MELIPQFRVSDRKRIILYLTIIAALNYLKIKEKEALPKVTLINDILFLSSMNIFRILLNSDSLFMLLLKKRFINK